MIKKLLFFPFILSSLIIGQSYVLNFDGSNDYLSVAASDNASTKLDGQITMSVWVFIEGADRQQIIYNDGFEVEWLGTANNYFRLQPGAVKSVSPATGTFLNRYQWHHVVITRNSSNSIQIYVNGEKSKYYVSNSDTADDIMYIGRDPDEGQYFDGSMDELAIWSSELSASQIDSLYNKGVPESATKILGAASSLKSYWKLEQSSGTTAANSVTNGAALTLNNGPTWKKFKQAAIADIMYNIRTGSTGSYPQGFIEYNNKIYFRADGGDNKGYEMWEYDPAADASSTNPKRISDIRSGSQSGVTSLNSWDREHWVVYNGKLYFSGNDGSSGDELYSYDGSSFTRVSDINSGSSSSSPKHFTAYNDKLYFFASAAYGSELYVYDGSSVSLVQDLASGTTGGVNPMAGMAVYNNKLYFQGYTSGTGYELYSYDGANIALVKDIISGGVGSNPAIFTLFDNKLFFRASDGTIGSELFYYDGSDVTGIDVISGTSGSDPYGLAVMNDTLYFEGYNSTYDWELWGYDAVKGARLIKDIYSGGGSHPHHLTVFDNKLYFQASDGSGTGAGGNELWYYDGNDAARVADIYTGRSGSYPEYFFATTKRIYFTANGFGVGSEPYYVTSGDPFPSIASVTSTTSNGNYNTGDAINITVNFSESVTLSSSGSMTVTLETGSTDRTISITSISSATSASGTYTVQAGDLSSDLTVKSISVSGTISDASDQVMEDFSIGSNLASSSALVVDGVNPTIASVKSTSTNTTYGTGASINITVNFSESVSVSSGGSMTVTLETGSTDRTVSITSISSTSSASGTYTVQDGDASNDLSVNSIALSSGASLSDAAGNAMSSFSIPADSNLSNFNAIIINTTKPSTPLGFAANSNYGSVGLSWTAVSGATGYKVFRSTSTTSGSFASVATPSASDNSYTDSPASVTRYYYYVMSVNSLGDSDPSDTLYAYPSKIWYVEMDGHDSDNDGKSKVAAFKTIEQAIKTNSSLATGDTIYVGPSISSANPTRYNGGGGYYDFGGTKGNILLNHNKNFVLIGTSGADSTIFNAENNGRHFTLNGGQSSATKFIGVTFYNGKLDDETYGGSISMSNNTKIQFISCVFDSNRVDFGFGESSNDAAMGGAIYIMSNSSSYFESCSFINNWAAGQHGYAGALFLSTANSEDTFKDTIKIVNSIFRGNYVQSKEGGYGGAIYNHRNMQITNSLFVNNGVHSNMYVSGSGWYYGSGGVIYSNPYQGSSAGSLIITNSTFDQNYSHVNVSNGTPYGALLYLGGSSNNKPKTFIFNSIITNSSLQTDSTDYTGSNNNDRTIIDYNKNDHSVYVNYSAIDGGTDQPWADDNVFDINPVYNDPAKLDYSLSNLSPVIGQGTSSFEGYSAPATDITGASRPSSNPDMGAYENSLSSSSAPLPVTGLTGIAKTNSAYLSWSAVKSSLVSTTDATNIKYLIYQGDSQVGTAITTSHTAGNLTNGTTYTFSVAAQDTSTSLNGAPSKAVSVKPLFSGPTWYVASSGGSAAGTADSDLGSRTVPLNHMSSAIELAVKGDTIVMMKGTHSGSNNRGIDWNAGKSLVIMGDPNYVADSTIIDAGGRDRHFKFDSGEDTTYQVIGLTLYNGKTTDYEGGGSVSINNNSNPVFRKVIFKQNVNEADNWEGGGAVSIRWYSNPSFYYCIFDGNTVERTGDNENEANGGAVFVQGNSSNPNQYALFDGCTFKNNVAKGKWGARGGAIRTHESQVIITNSLFHGNMTFANSDGTNDHSSNGGAVNISGPSYYSSSQQLWIGSQVQIINSTFANNLTKSGNTSSTRLSGSGLYLDSWGRSEKVWFFNNIVWGNKTSSDGSWQQVYFSNESGWGSTYLNYNVVQSSDDISSFQDDDSFETDPTFADSANGDYSLSNASSLIGKGRSTYEGVSAPTTDLLGLSRPNPSGSNPDIGAYENSLSITPYPGQIKNLTAVGGSGSVTLTWDAVADADSAYKVYQHTSAFAVSATYYVGATSAKTSPHETTYTITGLDNTTRYYLRVSAINKQGYEGTSAALDITPTYSGPVWWVSTTGSDNNEGSSGSPFKSLEHAIEHVTAGDTVMLKKGTYTGSDNRDIEISANNSTTNFDNFKNVVITSEKGADSTIIDAGGLGRHFTLEGNQTKTIDSTLQFIGLTFTGGQQSDHSGSFYIKTDSYYDNSINQNRTALMQPKFKDCVFKDNQAGLGNNGGYGGAFWINNGAPIFENCVFDSNYARGGGGAFNIGGDNNAIRDTLWFRNCTFKKNFVDDEGLQAGWNPTGGAIWLDFGMNVFIINSLFEENQVIQKEGTGGAYGGALSMNDSWSGKIRPYLWIINSRFTKNKVDHTGSNTNTHGGAIDARSPFIMINTLIDSNSAEFSGSNGRGMGGGMMISMSSQWDGSNEIQGHIYLINNTIADNYASSNNESGEGGGIKINNEDRVHGTWFNNIFWGNRSDDASGTSTHNVRYSNGQALQLNIDYNNIEFSEHVPDIMGSNSYDIDPSFYSATNYQLSPGSPLIGAGIATFNGITGPTFDILENARPNPADSSPDLGAYENSLAVSPYPKQVKNMVGIPGGGQVTLSWDANTETDLAKYVIYTSTVKDFTPAKEDSVGETTATVYNVTGLTNNTEYHFRVAAVNTDGYRGSFSDQLSVIPKYNGPIWWVSAEQQTNSDGSKDNPFDNIQSALEQINVGDTIYLEPGVHNSPGSHGISAESSNYPEFYVHGSTGDPKDVVIDAHNESRHFNLREVKAGFKNITFSEGEARTDNGGSGGGSFKIGFNSKVAFDNCIFYRNGSHDRDSWASGGAILLENVAEANFTNCVFRENKVMNGWRGGAVYAYEDQSDGQSSLHVFDHCKFIRNGVDLGNVDQIEHTSGGAIAIQGAAVIKNSIIDSSYIVHNYASGENVNVTGGAVSILYGGNSQDLSDWNNIPYSIFRSNIVSNTRVEVTGSVDGGSLSFYTKIKVENNLIINNSISSSRNISGDYYGGVRFSQPSEPFAPVAFINNTVAYNRMEKPSSGGAWTPGLLLGHNN